MRRTDPSREMTPSVERDIPTRSVTDPSAPTDAFTASVERTVSWVALTLTATPATSRLEVAIRLVLPPLPVSPFTLRLPVATSGTTVALVIRIPPAVSTPRALSRADPFVIPTETPAVNTGTAATVTEPKAPSLPVTERVLVDDRLTAAKAVSDAPTVSTVTTARVEVAPTAPRLMESELVEMRDTELTITCDADTSKAEELLKFTLADVIRMLETAKLGSALSEIVPKTTSVPVWLKEHVARRDTAPPGSWAGTTKVAVLTSATAPKATRPAAEVSDAATGRETALVWPVAPATVRVGTAVRVDAPITARMPSDVSVTEALRDTAAPAVRKPATVSVGAARRVAAPGCSRTPLLVRAWTVVRDTAAAKLWVAVGERLAVAVRVTAPSLDRMPLVVRDWAVVRVTVPEKVVDVEPAATSVALAGRLTAPSVERIPAVVRDEVLVRETAAGVSRIPLTERDDVEDRLTVAISVWVAVAVRVAVAVSDTAPDWTANAVPSAESVAVAERLTAPW
jgi:hypothetical protein